MNNSQKPNVSQYKVADFWPDKPVASKDEIFALIDRQRRIYEIKIQHFNSRYYLNKLVAKAFSVLNLEKEQKQIIYELLDAQHRTACLENKGPGDESFRIGCDWLKTYIEELVKF